MTDTTNATPMAEEHAEIRQAFGEQLHQIHQGLVQMASLVLENAKRAGEAVLDNRVDLVSEVERVDTEIDALYLTLEHQVFEVLARQQPVAKDLRFLVSATRILYELERSGDLAVNCTKAMMRVDGFSVSPPLEATLGRLIDESTALFGRGVLALDDMDATAGFRLDQEDDVVDEICSRFYQDLARESTTTGLASAIELSRVARFFERIADHAVNIAEGVAYTVTAHWPKSIDPTVAERNE
jgi:phosphate transport system protein